MAVPRAFQLIPHTIENYTLNPSISSSLYLLLTKAPEKIREPLLNILRRRFSEEGIKRILIILRLLSIVGWGLRINRLLNSWALNNWVWSTDKSKWVWDWEVAVVTGGCSGIGKEIVKGLTAKGIKVALLDIQPLPSDLEKNRKVTFIHCDVTSSSSIAEAAKTVRTKLGEVSILVNNAGVGRPQPIIETSNEWVTKIFQINIISHFWLTKEFLPHMIEKNKGHIVGMASLASFICPPSTVHYGATKAAVMAFHEGLTQEIKHIYKTPGVLSTVVHPYWVATPMVGGYESFLEKTQGKLLKPENVGKKVVNQILSCRGGQVIIPDSLKTAPGIRSYPNWLQELVRDHLIGKHAAQFPAIETSK